MRAFEYTSPKTTAQAVALLGRTWDDAQPLAGGTDLIALMKDQVVSPKRLVNIKDIEELRGIRSGASGLRIGALATLEELVDSAEVKQRYRALHQAAAEIHSPQVRNMGTVGGNLCQRPRCWYYRSGFGLLGQGPNGRSMVVDGDNRYHAILGNQGPAYFVSPSSLGIALAALGGTVRIAGPKGTREVPVAQFFRIPRTAEEREHDLQPAELVTEVRLPASKGTSATYVVREREALDWPLAAASVSLTMNGNRVQAARVVLGHVAPVPWPSPEAEAALAGKAVSEAVAEAAGEAAVAKARALSGNGYKVQLARVAVKRAVLAAAGGGAR